MCNKKIIGVVLAIVAVLCGVWFLLEWILAQQEDDVYTEITSEYITIPNTDITTQEAHINVSGEADGFVYPDFPKLLKENPECVGWVYIPGTEISYPVTKTGDNEKYLHRDFSGNRSSLGCVFMESQNNIEPLDKNTVLFGHHINGRGSMFGALLDYKEHDFYETHRLIQFDTVSRNYGWWEVFAVVHIDYVKNEYKYLRLGFTDDLEFMDWIKQAQDISLYDTGTKVQPTDRVLALSTCDRDGFGKNGRLIILARNPVR